MKIVECKRPLNQRMLPIFYDVSQSEVLEHKGIFADALLYVPIALLYGPIDKMNNWRDALIEAANLARLHLEAYR